MSWIEFLLIGIGLSMDAFAVSVGKGLSVGKTRLSHALSVGLWFGGFQALMPLIGYFLGSSFAAAVTSVDHWIAFGLLFIIGANMIREAVRGEDSDMDDSFSFKTMLILAVATSIDALACGVTFAFLETDIWEAVTIIGLTTFVLSIIGLKTGSFLGERFHKGAGIAGGIVLIAIGLKILIEHLIA